MDRSAQFWRYSLLLFVASTLSFMAAMSIASGIFFALCLYFLFFHGEAIAWGDFLRPRAYWLGTLGLISMALVSWLGAWLDPPLGMRITGIPEAKKFLYFLMPIVIAWALDSLTRMEKTRIEEHALWKVLFSMTALVALVAFVQFWSVDLFGREYVENSGRFLRIAAFGNHAHGQGLMGFHLSFASSMCFSFAYALARCLWLDPRVDPRRFFCFALLTLVSGIAIIYSYSRIAIPALALVIVVIAILRKPRWGVPALGLVLLLFCVAWFASEDLRGRILDRPGWTERAQLYRNAWAMFEDRPWIGVGFCKSGFFADGYAERLMGVNTAFGSHAHNNLLEAMATMGIPGLLAYLLWWGSFFAYAFRAFRRAEFQYKWLPAALFAAGLAFQVNGFTQVNFYDAKSQHAMVLWAGLVLALDWRNRRGISA